MGFIADLKAALTANFNATQRNRIVDAYANEFGYQATIDGQPNPQSKTDFAVERMVSGIQGVVRNKEQKEAVAAVALPPVITIG